MENIFKGFIPISNDIFFFYGLNLVFEIFFNTLGLKVAMFVSRVCVCVCHRGNPASRWTGDFCAKS